MCTTIYSDRICAGKEGADLKCLCRLAEEINSLEKDLEGAQNAFTQVVLESTASLNSIRLNFGIHIKEVLKTRTGSEQTDLRCVPDKQDVRNSQIYLLQKELEKSIVRSSSSIKISLMKLSSLFAQHDLLLLPFCELKAYYNQLLSQKRCNVLKLKSQIVTPKLSYADALQKMKEISDKIEKTSEKTKERILNLTEEQRKMDDGILDYSNFFTNEYKLLPQSSTFQ